MADKVDLVNVVGFNGFIKITDTTLHTGEFFAIVGKSSTAATFTTITAQKGDLNTSSAPQNVATDLPQGQTHLGDFTGIELASGIVWAYKSPGV